ncbi:MAG: tyrosine-type recombinase/integrase, partial [Gammaproteobacteria bacterium]
IRRACERGGIQPITAHVMRHTCASWLVQAGWSEAIVAEILGHKSRKNTITGRYTHLNVEHLRDAMDSIVQGQAGAADRCIFGTNQ